MFEKLNLLIPIGNFIRNKSIQNFLFLAIIQSSNILISIISVPLLIQSIGLDQFGLVNLGLSVMVLVNVLIVFGYNLSAPKEIAIYRDDKLILSQIISKILFAKILLGSISILLILLSILILNAFSDYKVIVIFSTLIIVSEVFNVVWFFQGMEKMKLVSIANIFSKLLFLMGIVLFISSPEQSHWVNFLMGLFGAIINLSLIVYIHSVLGVKFIYPGVLIIWGSIKENILLFLSSLSSYLSTNFGLVILSFFEGPDSLGMYSLAEKVVLVLRLFPALIIQAIYPNASRLFKNDQNHFFRFLKRVYLKVLLLGAFISIGTYFSANMIIEVLSRTGNLDESVNYLRILSPMPFLACLNIGNITLLLVADLKELLFRASWIMCLYTLIICTYLTGLMGGVGLCIGIISTEIVVFVLCLFLLYRHKKDLLHGFYL